MEEFVKYTIVIRPHFDLFGDRFSEREARREKEELMREKERLAERGIGVNGVMPKDQLNGVDVGSI